MKTNQKPKNIMSAIISILALCAAAILVILAAFVWVSPIIFFAALAAAFLALDSAKNALPETKQVCRR